MREGGRECGKGEGKGEGARVWEGRGKGGGRERERGRERPIILHAIKLNGAYLLTLISLCELNPSSWLSSSNIVL